MVDEVKIGNFNEDGVRVVVLRDDNIVNSLFRLVMGEVSVVMLGRDLLHFVLVHAFRVVVKRNLIDKLEIIDGV